MHRLLAEELEGANDSGKPTSHAIQPLPQVTRLTMPAIRFSASFERSSRPTSSGLIDAYDDKAESYDIRRIDDQAIFAQTFKKNFDARRKKENAARSSGVAFQFERSSRSIRPSP
jgi:site-specific recombinase